MQPTNENVRINYPLWNFEPSICLYLPPAQELPSCAMPRESCDPSESSKGSWKSLGSSGGEILLSLKRLL